MTGNGKDHRHFSRITFDCDVTIIDHGTHWRTHLLDISLNGALVTRPQDWQPAIGDECQLQLKLANSNVIITMEQATVAQVITAAPAATIVDIDKFSNNRTL